MAIVDYLLNAHLAPTQKSLQEKAAQGLMLQTMLLIHLQKRGYKQRTNAAVMIQAQESGSKNAN